MPPPPSRAWPLHHVRVRRCPNRQIPERSDLSVRRPSLYPTVSSSTRPPRRRRRHFTKSLPPIGTHATPDPPPPRMERRLCSAVLLRALPLMLRRPRSRSRRREDTIWPPHRSALTNTSTRSDYADCSMFFPLSSLRQLPQALSSNPMHVAPFFLSVFLGPSPTFVCRFFCSCLTRSSPKSYIPRTLTFICSIS